MVLDLLQSRFRGASAGVLVMDFDATVRVGKAHLIMMSESEF
jgi:hypothetical protein